VRYTARGDGLLTKAPSKAGDYYPIFVSLLGRLVEAQEELVDLLRAKDGLPARAERANRQRPALEFHGMSGAPASDDEEDEEDDEEEDEGEDEEEDEDEDDGDDDDENDDDDE
jgi:hypothetical protein